MSGFGLPIDVAREFSFSPLGFPVALRNARAVQAAVRNGASGQTLIYTPPAGKKGLLAGIVAFNPTAGAITINPMFRTGGTTYRYFTPQPGVSLAAGAQTVFANAFIVFDNPTGDSLFASNGAAGVSWWARIIEFDAAQTNVKSPRLTALATGDQTLYTCPAGKRAHILPFTPRTDQLGGVMLYHNSGGASRTINIHQPVAGSTASASTNKCAATATVVNDDVTTFTVPPTLDANESIVVNSDAAPTFTLCHCTVFEV